MTRLRTALIAILAGIAPAIGFAACGGAAPADNSPQPPPSHDPFGYRDAGDFFRVKVIPLSEEEGGGTVICVWAEDNGGIDCDWHATAAPLSTEDVP